MDRKKITISSLLILTVLLAGVVHADASRVAVIGFTAEDSFWTGTREQNDLLEDIAWLFHDGLAEAGEYTVVHREKLLKMIDDVRFFRGRRPAHSIVLQLRHRVNADFFAWGRLDDVEVQVLQQFQLGPIQFTEIKVAVNLSVDMISARTARVDTTYYGSGQATASWIDAVDSRGKKDATRWTPFSSQDDVFNRAIQRSVDDLIAKIVGEQVDRTPEQPAEHTVEAEIVSIVGSRMAVNRGERDGLKVGQTGEIIRYRTRGPGAVQLVVIGEAEITRVYWNSALLEDTYLNQEPRIGDLIRITVNDEATTNDRPHRRPIEVLETRDFTIEIHNAFASGGRVTIEGTAYAKSSHAELELILGNRDFYDHEGRRRDMSGRRVMIGHWLNASSNIASISKYIPRGEDASISWSFTGVPEDAGQLAWVELWLRTSHEGDISIGLADLKLQRTAHK